MQATRSDELYVLIPVLFLALELSRKTWRLGFSDGRRRRQVRVAGGDVVGVMAAIESARKHFKLPAGARVVSCYEAGRDGFWVDRALRERGVDNQVVDSSSIEVSRQARRAKTDRVDCDKLLDLLMRWWGGESRALSVVRVPSAEAEDLRELHRSRGHAKQQRTRERNRLLGLLVKQGIAIERIAQAAPAQLKTRRTGDGRVLGPDTLADLERVWESYQHFDAQVRAIEAEQVRRVKTLAAAGHGPFAMTELLMQLKSVGIQSAWTLVMELFGWRSFKNRRELAASVGLTPTPYNSGNSVRDQGVSKSGNRRVRALMIELAWLWLRWQPDSALSRWYTQKFVGSQRSRKVGIVALARKLLIDLWRFTKDGVVPEGALLRA